MALTLAECKTLLQSGDVSTRIDSKLFNLSYALLFSFPSYSVSLDSSVENIIFQNGLIVGLKIGSGEI